MVPWGLWQEMQVILPSRRGMCELRYCCARWRWWQKPHVSMTVGFTSWARGVMSVITVWQPVQDTSRESCALPFQNKRLPLVWQPRQIWFRRSTGVRSFLAKVIKPPTPLPPPAATWALPGPWQVSHAFFSLASRGCLRKRRPILVWANFSYDSTWQALHVSAPTKSSGLGVAVVAGVLAGL